MIDKLLKFLIEAKKQTYANENVKKQESSRKGSYDYEYSNGKMLYHDTYFDGTNFMGEEAVDKALRPALMQVGSDDIIPVRGPKEFINVEYRYTFEVTGDINCFEGEESIYKNNQKVYILKYHGGTIRR